MTLDSEGALPFRVFCERVGLGRVEIRGLVLEPEPWPGSSFPCYASGKAGPVEINEWQAVELKIGDRSLTSAARPPPSTPLRAGFSHRTRKAGGPPLRFVQRWGEMHSRRFLLDGAIPALR